MKNKDLPLKTCTNALSKLRGCAAVHRRHHTLPGAHRHAAVNNSVLLKKRGPPLFAPAASRDNAHAAEIPSMKNRLPRPTRLFCSAESVQKELIWSVLQAPLNCDTCPLGLWEEH